MVMELEPISYSEDDILWITQCLSVVADGGMWIIPDNMSYIRFHKKAKEYELLEGDPNDRTNRITFAILENELGYKRKESG